jgi:hypothetical protein
MNKHTLHYPDKSGLKLTVEFTEDAELYTHGVCIETIKCGQSGDLFTEFTEKAIDRMEMALARALKEPVAA